MTLAALASWWWPSVGVPALAVLSVWLFWRWQQRPRVVPTQPGAVLAPTDGRVVRIDRVRDPYANREALRISLTSSWWMVLPAVPVWMAWSRPCSTTRAPCFTPAWIQPRRCMSAMP